MKTSNTSKAAFILFLLQSFSASASVGKEYRALIRTIQEKTNQCKDQVSTILKTAYRVDDNAQDGQEAYKFIENEQEAMKFVNSLDLNKMTFEENSKVRGFLYKNCSSDVNIDEFKECDYSFELYFYHRALAYALKNYSWSQKSKTKVKESLQKYLHTISNANTDLLDKSMAIDLLKRLSEGELVELKSKDLIKELVKEAELISEKKKKRTRKDFNLFDILARTCGDSYNSHQDELADAKKLGIHFQEVLKKISFK